LSWPEIATRRDELDRDLGGLIRGVAEIDSVFVADEAGETQVFAGARRAPGSATLASPPANIANRNYFREARTGAEIVVDGPFISPVSGETIFNVARRLVDRDGSFRGVAVLCISPDHLTQFWRRVISPGDSISLVREDGTVLARYPAPRMTSVDQPAHFSRIAMDRMRLADQGQFDRTPSPIDGIARTLGYRRLPEYGLYIVSAVDRSNVLREWIPGVLAFGLLDLAAAAALILAAAQVIRHANAEQDALLRAEASEANYRALYARTPVPMYACNDQGILTAVSDRWLELLGYERDEAIGRHVARFYAEGSEQALADEWRRSIEGSPTRGSEHRLVCKSGEVLDVVIATQIDRDDTGAVARILAFVTDVTAQRRAETALRQAQRLEMVGQLTGGIAHDFNNLLQVVGGNAEMLRTRLDADDDVRALDAIERASDRGTRLVRQLLAFSRQQALSPSVIDLSERLSQLHEMLVGSFHGDIVVTVDVPATVWPIEVDAGELELALLNIAVNARDAMPNGGTFAVSARNVTLTGGTVPLELAGDFVELTLADTGVGIAPENINKVFEPFFTTKPVGQGTGLGLSQVFGFTRQSGGIATIESTPRRGTSIILYLPRSRSRVDRRDADIAEVPTGGAETILIVEDDAEVAAVSQALLGRLSYRTLIAANAQEAFALLAHEPVIDLVFTDIRMPGGMSGADLARALRQHYPNLAVVLTTGCLDGSETAASLGVPLVGKPFRLEELGEQIRAALARRQTTSPAREVPAHL
jgi:PAS domain S-box-containing protein